MTEETQELTLEQSLAQNFEAMSQASDEETPSDGETAAPADNQGVDEVVTQAEDAATAEETPEGLQPLETWSEDDKSLFNSLDPNAQKFVLENYKRFQSDYTKEKQTLQEQAKRYERIDQVLSPYEGHFRSAGLSMEPYVAQAMQAYMAYLSNPVDTMRALIGQANITPEQLGLGEDVEPLDPTTQRMQQEIASLRQQVSQQGQSQVTEAQSQIDRFRSETNESGELKHPHFESVRHLMGQLVSDGKSLEEAYEQAVWSLPDFRKSQLEAEAEKARKEAVAKAQKESQQKVSKAKKAAGVLPSSDADKSEALPKMEKGWKGWENALSQTASNLR